MGEQKGQTGDSMPAMADAAGAASLLPELEKRSSTTNSLSLRHRVFLRLAHLWFLLSRGMTLGVRALVLDGEGRIFLVRHSYIPGWHLPGGGVETGQSLQAALEMELREEGNIFLTSAPELAGMYLNLSASKRDHVALFVVRNFTQSGPRLPDREIVEAGFFARDALPDGTTQGTLRRLSEVLDGQPISSFW